MPREERRRASGWDPQRITSGPAAIAAALKGRIHGCTRTNSRKRQILLLHRGRRPYMAQSCVALTCPVLERSAAIRPLRLSQGRRACRPQAQGDRCDRRSVHLFILHGVPAHIRSDNGQEFVAKAVQESIAVARRQDRLHRAGQSLGERLHRDATSCSTAKSSTRSERPELSSRAGGATTTRSGRTPHLDTSHQHRSVRARLRRVAACATPSGSGHAGETANLKLTFHLDHSAGADHQRQESLIVPPAVLSYPRTRREVVNSRTSELGTGPFRMVTVSAVRGAHAQYEGEDSHGRSAVTSGPRSPAFDSRQS